jgi:large subunit ribosomal protein L24
MQKIRRNDQVTVLTGRDKGKRGEVLRVMDDGRALVSGINIVKKHTRPDPYRGIQGGIVEKEAPIQLSNLALWASGWKTAKRCASSSPPARPSGPEELGGHD